MSVARIPLVIGVLFFTLLDGLPGLLVSLSVVAGLELFVLALRLASPEHWTERDPSRRDVAPPRAPRTFRRVQNEVRAALHSRWELEQGLRRRLQSAAELVLRERHGIDLVDEPERARAVLGDRGWALLDPARPLTTDRQAPGIDLAELDDLVTRLEGT